MTNIKTFTKLKTERLTLRKIEVSDSDVILFLRSDAIINKYIDRPEHRKTKTIEDAISHIKKLNLETEHDTSFPWGITLGPDSKIIGTICLWNFSKEGTKAEVGYDLKPAYQGKGIMSEALQVVIDFGFKKLNINHIEAFTHHKNRNSIKLLQNNGFTLIENKTDADNPTNIIFEIQKKCETIKGYKV